MILDDGRPLVVESEHDRIGRGAWARLFASAIVGDEGASLAERGRLLARNGGVHTVSVARGEVSADIDGCTVTLRADPIPTRIWSAVVRGARTESLQAGVEGREQSVHLEHLMRFEWDEPLIPDRAGLQRACTCDRGAACEHVAALAYVVADRIDRDPSLLLLWRGCETAPEQAPQEELAPAELGDDAWEAGTLPAPRALRPLPVGAVLKSLGQSEIRVGAGDLSDVLARAYASFSRR